MAHASVSRGRLQATLACLVTLLLWWRWGGVIGGIVFAFAVILASLAWFVPARYAPVQRVLDRFAHGLVTAVSWLLLGLVYFGILSPMRAWCTLTRRDPLQLRKPKSPATTFLQPVRTPSPDRFHRQF